VAADFMAFRHFVRRQSGLGGGDDRRLLLGVESSLLLSPDRTSCVISNSSEPSLSNLGSKRQELDVPVSSMHADPLSISDEPGGLLYPHDGWQAILPRDYCPMGHQASDFRDEATYRNEQGRPTGVRVGRDQDVARFEIGLGHVQNDSGPSLDGPGGNW
jgi:hypothetical protein